MESCTAAAERQRTRLLVALDLELARELAPQAQKLAIERLRLARGQLRALKALDVLRIGNLAREAGEVRELASQPLAPGY